MASSTIFQISSKKGLLGFTVESHHTVVDEMKNFSILNSDKAFGDICVLKFSKIMHPMEHCAEPIRKKKIKFGILF